MVESRREGQGCRRVTGIAPFGLHEPGPGLLLRLCEVEGEVAVGVQHVIARPDGCLAAQLALNELGRPNAALSTLPVAEGATRRDADPVATRS